MPNFVYSLEASRYRDTVSGRFISEKQVRDWTDAVADKAGDRMAGIAQRLQSGGISLADFQAQAMMEIKQAHLAASLAAHGGRAVTSQADWGYMGSQIKSQFAYLDAWCQDIAAGRAPLDNRLLARAKLYGNAASITYENVRLRDARLRGMALERWFLQAAEHCSGCSEQSGKGWVPTGTLPSLGTQQCRVNCKCRKEFRRADAA